MRVKLGLCIIALCAATFVACGGGSSTGGGGGGGNNPPTLQSISVSPSTPTIIVGGTQPFTATGHYSDNSTKDLTTSATWSSSDTTVATIAASGVATGVKAGAATITATSGTVSGNTGLTVNAAPPPVLQSITVGPSNPGVFVGSSLQFAATGHYDDGSQKDITGSVTWASSDTSKATINSGGLASGVHGGSTSITATSGSVQGSANLTVTALLNSIAIAPIGPAVQQGHTVQFTATGSYNDGTEGNCPAQPAWASSNTSDATISASGLATGVAAGAVTITGQCTSADGTIVNATTALNVVQNPIASLSGPYAFVMTGADTRGNQNFAGSFVADGNGNITSGVEDANTGAGLNTGVAFTGTYSMYPDGRGQIIVAANAIHPNGLTLRFILSNSGAAGRLMEFDGAGNLKGELKVQTPSDTLQNAKYVFLTSGADATGGKMQEVGVFKGDGAGNITAGKFDANDAGTITNAVALVATTYTAPDANGRGQITISTGTITQLYDYFVIDSTRVNLIQVDPSPNSALAGLAEVQDPALTSTNADLNGSFANLLQHPMLVGDPNLRGEFGIVGHLAFDGAGNITDGIQDEHHNFRVTYPGITGTYNISGVNARGVMNEIIPQSPAPLTETYIFYMVSTSKMLLLHTQNGPDTVVTPDAGVGEQQSPPFDNTTLNGSYALSGSELAGSNTEVLAQLVFDGSGNISGIEDVSQNGTLFSRLISESYLVDPDASSGRGEFGPDSPDPLTDYLIYVISPNKAWSVGADQPDLKPDTMGAINLQ